MHDPRVHKLADLLTNYCLCVRKGERVLLEAPRAAEPLMLALLEQVLEAGGHPHLLVRPDRFWEVFMRHAKEEQLSFTPTFELLAYERFEALVLVAAHENTRHLNRVDARANRIVDEAWAPVYKARFQREGSGQLRRVSTAFPTQGYAQESGMAIGEFEHLFFGACHVDSPGDEPIPFWQQMERENALKLQVLQGHSNVQLRSADCDLSFSVAGRKFISAAGKVNMPDGEVFTGPVEDSADGWIRFSYPSTYLSVEVSGVELTFENGKVVKGRARVGDAILQARLETDEGASRLGEFGIGTNYGVAQPTGMILLDEKIGGSIHLALGNGYPATGNHNESALHWDLITDFSNDSEIALDGDIVYRNGHFV